MTLTRGQIFSIASLLIIISFIVILYLGAVNLPLREVFYSLLGKEVDSPYASVIVLQARLPMAIAAFCCGATLSVAGLMMQTIFNNPLAGPSVLGISSGASLGVALFMLASGGIGFSLSGFWSPFLSIIVALGGSILTIIILLFFSSILKSGLTLLIVGIMISYLCSSGISLLNYFSPADEIRNFIIWGLGSFSSLRLNSSLWLLIASIIALSPVFLFIKPLNAMLLGERHLESLGFNGKAIRNQIFFVTGLLVGIPTAFCGPIGFIGLIVPHLCRIIMRTSNHLLLIPACIIFGALTGLICAIIGILPSPHFGIIPINIITPIIGVPVILYLLINRKKLPYFS